MDVFDLLPDRFRVHSISSSELVLPVAMALEALDLLEARGAAVLGWEGWIKDSQGRVGHGSAPQGTASLESLSPREAAELCRRTIREDARRWARDHPATDETLHICITVR